MRYFPSPDGNTYNLSYTPRQKKTENTGTKSKVVPILNPEQYPIPTEIRKATFNMTVQRLQGRETRKKVTTVLWIL